eukprot:Polyplicarium_translucidae@DN2835_c0_g1_i1.p1
MDENATRGDDRQSDDSGRHLDLGEVEGSGLPFSKRLFCVGDSIAFAGRRRIIVWRKPMKSRKRRRAIYTKLEEFTVADARGKGGSRDAWLSIQAVVRSFAGRTQIHIAAVSDAGQLYLIRMRREPPTAEGGAKWRPFPLQIDPRCPPMFVPSLFVRVPPCKCNGNFRGVLAFFNFDSRSSELHMNVVEEDFVAFHWRSSTTLWLSAALRSGLRAASLSTSWTGCATPAGGECVCSVVTFPCEANSNLMYMVTSSRGKDGKGRQFATPMNLLAPGTESREPNALLSGWLRSASSAMDSPEFLVTHLLAVPNGWVVGGSEEGRLCAWDCHPMESGDGERGAFRLRAIWKRPRRQRIAVLLNVSQDSSTLHPTLIFVAFEKPPLPCAFVIDVSRGLQRHAHSPAHIGLTDDMTWDAVWDDDKEATASLKGSGIWSVPINSKITIGDLQHVELDTESAVLTAYGRNGFAECMWDLRSSKRESSIAWVTDRPCRGQSSSCFLTDERERDHVSFAEAAVFHRVSMTPLGVGLGRLSVGGAEGSDVPVLLCPVTHYSRSLQQLTRRGCQQSGNPLSGAGKCEGISIARAAPFLSYFLPWSLSPLFDTTLLSQLPFLNFLPSDGLCQPNRPPCFFVNPAIVGVGFALSLRVGGRNGEPSKAGSDATECVKCSTPGRAESGSAPPDAARSRPEVLPEEYGSRRVPARRRSSSAIGRRTPRRIGGRSSSSSSYSCYATSPWGLSYISVVMDFLISTTIKELLYLRCKRSSDGVVGFQDAPSIEMPSLDSLAKKADSEKLAAEGSSHSSRENSDESLAARIAYAIQSPATEGRRPDSRSNDASRQNQDEADAARCQGELLGAFFRGSVNPDRSLVRQSCAICVAHSEPAGRDEALPSLSLLAAWSLGTRWPLLRKSARRYLRTCVIAHLSNGATTLMSPVIGCLTLLADIPWDELMRCATERVETASSRLPTACTDCEALVPFSSKKEVVSYRPSFVEQSKCCTGDIALAIGTIILSESAYRHVLSHLETALADFIKDRSPLRHRCEIPHLVAIRLIRLFRYATLSRLVSAIDRPPLTKASLVLAPPADAPEPGPRSYFKSDGGKWPTDDDHVGPMKRIVGPTGLPTMKAIPPQRRSVVDSLATPKWVIRTAWLIELFAAAYCSLWHHMLRDKLSTRPAASQTEGKGHPHDVLACPILLHLTSFETALHSAVEQEDPASYAALLDDRSAAKDGQRLPILSLVVRFSPSGGSQCGSPRSSPAGTCRAWPTRRCAAWILPTLP